MVFDVFMYLQTLLLPEKACSRIPLSSSSSQLLPTASIFAPSPPCRSSLHTHTQEAAANMAQVSGSYFSENPRKSPVSTGDLFQAQEWTFIPDDGYLQDLIQLNVSLFSKNGCGPRQADPQGCQHGQAGLLKLSYVMAFISKVVMPFILDFYLHAWPI